MRFKKGLFMNKSVDKEIELDPKQKVVRVLHAGGFKVIGLGFMKGQILDKHKTQAPAFLFIHTGSVGFSIEGETTLMPAGSYFEIPAEVEHEVKAIEDSRLLLIK